MPLRLVHFAAILCSALALVPAGAHLFELPAKIALDQASYFTVQGIYRGWSLFGIALFGALAANLASAIMLRRRKRRFVRALIAAALISLNLGIFFAWTYPTNQATRNWTIVPDGWEALRAQWEYSHAVNAIIAFAALCAIAASALWDVGERRPGDD